MTSRRAARALLAAAFAVAVISGVPAAALEQEGIVLPGRSTVEHDYPPIPANDPASVTVDNTLVTPDECKTLPSCANVAIDVEIPEINPGDDFYVVLTIGFDAQDISDNNVQPVKSNDLDTFLWDDKQTEDGDAYTQIASSASGDNPEVIKAFEPELGRYNLVVVNFAGGNTGWRLKAESLVGEFDKPFEQLSPTGGTNNPRNKPLPPAPPRTTTTLPATTTTVTIAPGAVAPDLDFEGDAFAPDNDFQDQLLANAEEASSILRAPKGKPSSPSTVSVLLAMVVFPGAVIALFVFGMRRKGGLRRRRTAAI